MDDLSVQLALAFTSVKEEADFEVAGEPGNTGETAPAVETPPDVDRTQLPPTKKQRVLTRRVSWIKLVE